MKTIKELVLETVNHYNSRNRGFDSKGACLYSASGTVPGIDDFCCAVGRCIDPAKAPEEVWSFRGSSGLLFGLYTFDILKEEYRDIELMKTELDFEEADSMAFQPKYVSPWQKLQQLHDSHENWNAAGLSLCGVRRVLNLFGLEIASIDGIWVEN